MTWSADSGVVTADSGIATADGFFLAGLGGPANIAAVASAGLTTGITAAGAASIASSAAGALTNWASVVLTSPLWTGLGSIVDSHLWPTAARLPQVGDTIFYDPAFVTVLADSTAVSTSNHVTAVLQFNDGTGMQQGVLVLTPGMAAYADSSVTAMGALTIGAVLLAAAAINTAATGALGSNPALTGAASIATAASAALSTQVRLAGAPAVATAATGILTNWATVVLTSPLNTGLGSIVNAHLWPTAARLPQVGDTIDYDPTFITIFPDSTVSSTSNTCVAVAQFNDGTGFQVGLIVFTPGMATFADIGAVAVGALSTGVLLAAAASALVSAAGALATHIPLASAATIASVGSATLTAAPFAGNALVDAEGSGSLTTHVIGVNYPPSRIEIAIYQASSDGLYWGRWPNGNKPSLSGSAGIAVAIAAALGTGIKLAGAPSIVIAGSGTLSGGSVPAQVTGLMLLQQGQTSIGPYPGNYQVPPLNYYVANAAGTNVLGWAAVTGATTYEIQRESNRSGTFLSLATGLTSLNYTDTTANNSVASTMGSGPVFWTSNTYRYQVRARNANGAGPWSTTQSALFYANGVQYMQQGDFDDSSLTSNYTYASGSPPGGGLCLQNTTNSNFGLWNPYVGNNCTQWAFYVGFADYLQFDINPQFTGSDFTLHCLIRNSLNNSGGDSDLLNTSGGLATVHLSDYVTLTPNQWQTVSVPLADIMTGGIIVSGSQTAQALQQMFYKVDFQDVSGTHGHTWLIDNMIFRPA